MIGSWQTKLASHPFLSIISSKSYMRTIFRTTGSIRSKTRFWHQCSPHQRSPSGTGPSSFSVSIASFVTLPPSLMMSCFATTLKLILMMSSKRRSNTVKPVTTKSLRLGLQLYDYLMKPVLPKISASSTSLRGLFNIKPNARQLTLMCFMAPCIATTMLHPLPLPRGLYCPPQIPAGFLRIPEDSCTIPGLSIGWCASQFFQSCGGTVADKQRQQFS